MVLLVRFVLEDPLVHSDQLDQVNRLDLLVLKHLLVQVDQLLQKVPQVRFALLVLPILQALCRPGYPYLPVVHSALLYQDYPLPLLVLLVLGLLLVL